MQPLNSLVSLKMSSVQNLGGVIFQMGCYLFNSDSVTEIRIFSLDRYDCHYGIHLAGIMTSSQKNQLT